MREKDSRIFWDEEAAYEFVERQVWPDGPVCPHCGGTSRVGRLRGQSTRPHTYKCYDRRKPFTVKIGTIFEDSKVPMHKWLQAMVLSGSTDNQINVNQICTVLGVSFKTASAMLGRLRGASAQLQKQGTGKHQPGSSVDAGHPDDG